MFRSKTALALVALIGVLLLAAFSLGSRQVAARAGRAIEARLDLDANIGGASLGLGSVSLKNVELRSEDGGLVLKVARATLASSPWRIALGGLRAVDNAKVVGVDVEVDLTRSTLDASLMELRQALRPRPRASGSQTPDTSSVKRAQRTVEVEDARIRVRDEQGPLIDATFDRIRRGTDGFSLDVRGAFVGDAKADHADFGTAAASLSKASGVWQVKSLQLARSSIRWIETVADDKEPLVRRLRKAMITVVGERAARAPKSAAGGKVDDQPAPSWFGRIAAGAEVHVGPLHIESHGADGRVDEIDDMRVVLVEDGGGWFRSRGAGKATGDSQLSWDVRAHPVDLRGEGTVSFQDVSLALVAPFVPEIPFHEPELATVEGELTIHTDAAPSPIAFRGRLALNGLAFSSERLAPEPIVDLNVKLSGAATWDPRSHTLIAQDVRAQLGDAEVQVTGTVERGGGHYRYALDAVVPQTDCNQLAAAVPKSVLGKFKRFSWSGTWGATASLFVDSEALDDTGLTVRTFNGCNFVSAPWNVKVARFRKPFRHRVEEPDDEIFRMTTGPGTDNWSALQDISPFVKEAVVAHEDAGFYKHHGIAVYAIRDALVRNLREGRYALGASTISMQLAKNLFLARDKTIARKVQEAVLTWWLETELNKEEILELYLNVIEYGPAVYGIRNASRAFFSREPADLSPAEAAFMACVLPSPKKFAFMVEQKRLSAWMKAKMRRLLEQMARKGRLTDDALVHGLVELEAFNFYPAGGPPPPDRALPRVVFEGFGDDPPPDGVDVGQWEPEGGGETAISPENKPATDAPAEAEEEPAPP